MIVCATRPTRSDVTDDRESDADSCEHPVFFEALKAVICLDWKER
jgi:hypothetical protein